MLFRMVQYMVHKRMTPHLQNFTFRAYKKMILKDNLENYSQNKLKNQTKQRITKKQPALVLSFNNIKSSLRKFDQIQNYPNISCIRLLFFHKLNNISNYRYDAGCRDE